MYSADIVNCDKREGDGESRRWFCLASEEVWAREVIHLAATRRPVFVTAIYTQSRSSPHVTLVLNMTTIDLLHA
jgi:hypothetical protein